MRIGVVAPSSPFSEEPGRRVTEIAAALYPAAELVFHPQCFLTHNHFAGRDSERAAAFVQFANDPGFDAIWFARGGYGACRIAPQAIAELGRAARDKAYLGYSDAGFLLGGLYRAGFERVAHGPMPQDSTREGGEAAVGRALSWLVEGDASALEPSVAAGSAHAAFNLMVLSQMIGTGLEPDLEDHVLMVEEVDEHMYRIDRSLFHLTESLKSKRLAGLRLGRCSRIPENDPDFGEDEESIARLWCDRTGIKWLGRADIGHDSANHIVPFGTF